MSDLLDHPAAIRPGEELDLVKLEPYLRAHFPGDAVALLVRQFPSGHSNLTYSMSLGARELVLRRPPFGSKVKSAHDMGREFRVLSKLHAVFAPAPEVLFYCDDDSIIGAPFYVMNPVHGIILRRLVPPGLDFSAEMARRLSESFVDNLIRLHRVDYAAVGLSDLGRPEGYLDRQVRGWTERYYGSKTHEYPEVEKISAWMAQQALAARSISLIHNDYQIRQCGARFERIKPQSWASSIGRCARSVNPLDGSRHNCLWPIGSMRRIRKNSKKTDGDPQTFRAA